MTQKHSYYEFYGSAIKVVLLDLWPSTGLDTAEELNSKYGPGSALFIRCDVTNKAQLNG